MCIVAYFRRVRRGNLAMGNDLGPYLRASEQRRNRVLG